MADRRYEERWRDNPNRSQGFDTRSHYERNRSGQFSQSENYPERESGGARYDDQEWRRSHGDEPWREPRSTERYGREQGQRYFNQGPGEYMEGLRERPYAGTGSYGGEGGFVSHVDPYRQNQERGYGATSTGTGWGSADLGRHRMGTLTDSAASSARYGSRYSGRSDDEGYSSRGAYAGRGPKGYRRSDERIHEEVCELLTRSDEVDASEIEVSVSNGTVTLTGTVEDRRQKRIAEDVAQEASGVTDVQNQIRVQEWTASLTQGTGANTQAAAAGAGGQQSSAPGILGLETSNRR